jgi:hypothetical protein
VRRIIACLIITVIAVTVGMLSPTASAVSAHVEGRVAPAVVVQSVTDHATPQKPPCPACPRAYKNDKCAAPCGVTLLMSVSAGLVIPVRAASGVASPCRTLASINEPPDPPPPKS